MALIEIDTFENKQTKWGEQKLFKKLHWASLPVQWLRLGASTAVGMGSIPGQGTKIHRPSSATQKQIKIKTTSGLIQSNTTSHKWLSKLKSSSLVSLATLQLLNIHLWLMAAVLFRTNERTFFLSWQGFVGQCCYRLCYCFWKATSSIIILILSTPSHFQSLKKKKKKTNYHRKIHSCPRFYHVTNSMLSEIIQDWNFKDLGVFGD